MTYTVLHLTGFDIYISQFGEISIKRTETKNSIKEDVERISGLIAMVKQKQYDDFGHRELKPSKNSKRYDLQERQTIAQEKIAARGDVRISKEDDDIIYTHTQELEDKVKELKNRTRLIYSYLMDDEDFRTYAQHWFDNEIK